jgi:hypothetical protein
MTCRRASLLLRVRFKVELGAYRACVGDFSPLRAAPGAEFTQVVVSAQPAREPGRGPLRLAPGVAITAHVIHGSPAGTRRASAPEVVDMAAPRAFLVRAWPWLEEHIRQLPSAARPARDPLPAGRAFPALVRSLLASHQSTSLRLNGAPTQDRCRGCVLVCKYVDRDVSWNC